MVGKNQVQIKENKLERIKNAEPPKTKRQVRSFLGLTGYYKKFIASYAEIATSLTDQRKKGMPNNAVWEDEHGKAFTELCAPSHDKAIHVRMRCIGM